MDEKTGLNDETVEANREKYGANTVTKIKSNGVFIDFSKHLLLLFINFASCSYHISYCRLASWRYC